MQLSTVQCSRVAQHSFKHPRQQVQRSDFNSISLKLHHLLSIGDRSWVEEFKEFCDTDGDRGRERGALALSTDMLLRCTDSFVSASLLLRAISVRTLYLRFRHVLVLI